MPKRFSTKNLKIIQEPAGERSGVGVFELTDDYSIFHYGKMPDQIPGKGEAISRMAVANFEHLERKGIETHFRRFIPPNNIEFQLFRVIDPEQIEANQRNYLIPLQVIFRNLLPQGASVFRRLKRGQVTLEQLGLTSLPEPGDVLEKPMIEFTTKLEEIDRFVDEREAKEIARLSHQEMDRLKNLTFKINDLITQRARSAGLVHADGKIEFGFNDAREIVLVDVTGTPDENRFTFEGFHLSKQVMRNYYMTTGIEEKVQGWVDNHRPRNSWPIQDPLPEHLLLPISNMYKSLCERWIGDVVWNAPILDDVIRSLRSAGLG